MLSSLENCHSVESSHSTPLHSIPIHPTQIIISFLNVNVRMQSPPAPPPEGKGKCEHFDNVEFNFVSTTLQNHFDFSLMLLRVHTQLTSMSHRFRIGSTAASVEIRHSSVFTWMPEILICRIEFGVLYYLNPSYPSAHPYLVAQ